MPALRGGLGLDAGLARVRGLRLLPRRGATVRKRRVRRDMIGVEGSFHRSLLDFCVRAGLVLVDARDLGHSSRMTLVFRNDGYMTEITIDDLPLPTKKEKK